MKLDREKWLPCASCESGFCMTAEEYHATDLYMNVSGDPPFIGASGDDDICVDISFCPICGRPLTEGAWEYLERRLFACQGKEKI